MTNKIICHTFNSLNKQVIDKNFYLTIHVLQQHPRYRVSATFLLDTINLKHKFIFSLSAKFRSIMSIERSSIVFYIRVNMNQGNVIGYFNLGQILSDKILSDKETPNLSVRILMYLTCNVIGRYMSVICR